MSIITRLIGDKRRWRQYKARTRQLPPSYHTAIDALERYLMCFGPGDGDTAASMFEDLADLFEQSAATGTPIRAVVGDDPVEFAETFLQNYSEGGYVPTRARKQLTDDIERAAGNETGKEDKTV